VLRCKDLTHYRSKPSTQPQHFGFLVHGNSASPPSHKRKIHGAMSVIGISLTDIVKGVKVLKDAATALKAGPEGARQQFEDAHAAFSPLEQAAADLTPSTSSEIHQMPFTAIFSRENAASRHLCNLMPDDWDQTPKRSRGWRSKQSCTMLSMEPPKCKSTSSPASLL
jgi:hypothetical protein